MAETALSNAETVERTVASDSTCFTNFGQLRKPWARAMTNCASVSAHVAVSPRESVFRANCSTGSTCALISFSFRSSDLGAS